MSMWDQAEAAADAAQTGGLFLSLKNDGDKATVVFRGEPATKNVIWNGTGYEDYDPKQHKDKKPSVRIKINAYNTQEDQMQIWEMNAATFKGLVIIKKKYGLDKVFEITRNGKKGDTKTTYTILPERDLDQALAERLEVEPLNDLNGGGSTPPTGSGGHDNNRSLLLGMLKSLPRESVMSFLEDLGVQKVKDIPDGRVLEALKLAKKLSESTNDNEQEEVDPFA